MPFEALSVESRIEQRLRELRSSISFLAALDAIISQTRLNSALRGHRRLDARDSVRLNELTLRLMELSEGLAPLPISFSNPEEIRRLLEIKKSKDEISEVVAQLFQ